MILKCVIRPGLLLALALALASPVLADSLRSVLTPSPLSIALTVGQWLLKEDRKVYYVQVESTADDKEQARREGFRLAVEMAVGALVVAETEVRNKELVRQDILKYSSGYVDNFSIKSEAKVGNKVRLVMDVWVGESTIANRLLNVSKAEGSIDGARVAAQQESLKSRQDSAARLLESVVRDFPRRAFDIKIGKTLTRVDGERTTIAVPVEIAWNKKYFEALLEAIDKTKDGTESGAYNFKEHASIITYRKIGGWINYFASYQNTKPVEILSQHFFESYPQVRINFKDELNALLAFNCREIAPLTGVFYGDAKMVLGLYPLDQPTGQFIANGAPAAHIGIYGDYEVGGNLATTIQGNTDLIARMRKVEVQIVRKSDCSSSGEGNSWRADAVHD